MNRALRRAQAKRERRQQVAHKLETGPMAVTHGHTDTNVLVQFGRPADHLLFTIEQAEDFITKMRTSISMMKAHMANPKSAEQVMTMDPARAKSTH